MIEDLKPYPETRDSGLPWLGQVPRHWSISRIKSVLRESDLRSTDGKGTLLSLTRVRGLIPHRDMTNKMHSAKTLTGYKTYRPGQIVMNRMQAWSGMFGAGKLDGLVSPDYAVFDVLGGHTVKLILERLKSPDLVSQFALESKGIGSGFNRLYTDRFGSIAISLPPPEEQAAIARFLAWASNRLDRAIRAKRRIIALLNEQKQAIIHRAVTRGLDPSVPLKDSGIPWLGEIPEHWEVLRAKHLFREEDRRSEFGTETHLAMSQRLGLVPSSMVQSTLRSQSYAGAKLCSRGDLVLNRLKAHLGVFAVAKQDGVISPDYTVLRKLNNAHTDYYALILRSPGCRGELRTRAKGIVEGFWRLYTADFYDIRLPVPPIEEQHRIIEITSRQTGGQDHGISSLEHEIELICEYRTRLIADVVTGKLDVREVSAGLPEEELQEQPDVAAGYAADEAEDDAESDLIDNAEE